MSEATVRDSRNQIFRKKSLKKISNPDELSDYLRLATPGLWLLIAGLTIMLVGIVVWGVVGHLDTTMTVGASVSDGVIHLYIPEDAIDQVKVDCDVTVGDRTMKITEISSEPFQVDTGISSYVQHVGGFGIGDWVYDATADTDLPAGSYKAVITVDSVSPSSFVFN